MLTTTPNVARILTSTQEFKKIPILKEDPASVSGARVAPAIIPEASSEAEEGTHVARHLCSAAHPLKGAPSP